MIRKLLMASVATATIAGSALAADLPSRKAPPPAFIPPPVMTWTGAYIGVNGGGIWTNSNNVVTTATDFGAVAFPTVSAAAAAAGANIIPTRRNTNFLVGGTWGYNWQWNNIVLGTESDFQGVFGCNNNNNNGGGFGFGGGNNNNNCGGTAVGIAPIVGAPGFNVLSQQTINRRLDYLSTSRVRAGFLVTPSFLIYATGGVAIGHVRVDSSIISSVTPLPFALNSGISFANYSQLKAGFVGGGGLEWMFLPNWSVKAEALYYDLGRSTLNQNFVSTTAAGVVLSNTGTQTSWRNNGVIARAGINYHLHWFDAAPVVARY
ncbi:MAG: outer rane immunogenic protein [Methylobacteriaceae bacterium]|nr:outer rane immunogenic protein [Methylobacteriaceae bacterium]